MRERETHTQNTDKTEMLRSPGVLSLSRMTQTPSSPSFMRNSSASALLILGLNQLKKTQVSL